GDELAAPQRQTRRQLCVLGHLGREPIARIIAGPCIIENCNSQAVSGLDEFVHSRAVEIIHDSVEDESLHEAFVPVARTSPRSQSAEGGPEVLTALDHNLAHLIDVLWELFEVRE